jgi:hypothetical protein
MPDYVAVGRFTSLSQADTVHGVLDAAGLNPRIRDVYFAGLSWFYVLALGGVRVEVPAEHLDEARQVLAEEFAWEEPLSSEDKTYLQKRKRNRRNLGLIGLFLIAPWVGVVAFLLLVNARIQKSAKG